MTLDPAAFWSYAHEDDRLDNGGILELARSLGREFSLISGQNLQLFIDRSDIAWGDEWRSRINLALGATTFFIPVLSPRYFTRSECRRELISFNTQAEILGSTDFILPIVYAAIPNFEEDNADELIALSSRFQYVDWTTLRLENSQSSAYRTQVNALATRLLEIGARMADQQLKVEEELSEVSDEPGLLDLVTESMKLLPDWSQALESYQIYNAQMAVTTAAYAERMLKLQATRPSAGAVFALSDRWAQEVEPNHERFIKFSRIFAKSTIQLNPLMTQILDTLDASPELVPFASEVIDAVTTPDFDDSPPPEMPPEVKRLISQMSRRLRQMMERSDRANESLTEPNRLVEEWRSRLATLGRLG